MQLNIVASKKRFEPNPLCIAFRTNLLCWFQRRIDDLNFASAIKAIPHSSICHVSNHLFFCQNCQKKPRKNNNFMHRFNNYSNLMPQDFFMWLSCCRRKDNFIFFPSPQILLLTCSTGLLTSFGFMVSVSPNFSFATPPTQHTDHANGLFPLSASYC